MERKNRISKDKMKNIFKQSDDESRIKRIILDSVFKRRGIIHGQQSINYHLPEYLRRMTTDYDVITNKPKSSAVSLAERLNKEFGTKKYYVKKAQHENTWKVMTGNGKHHVVADYTRTKTPMKSTKAFGLKYAELSGQEKILRRMILEDASLFRREKDLLTLSNIEKFKKNQGIY